MITTTGSHMYGTKTLTLLATGVLATALAACGTISEPASQKVAFVQCADPSCAILAGYLDEAVKARGWELVTVSATATDPGAAVQQAIDAGVDYLVTTPEAAKEIEGEKDGWPGLAGFTDTFKNCGASR
ncbi:MULTISPECIES: hypothetical protein [unclassified Nonomuraea]|uniref:hypothetical protein n=1 Tax=unclassified Nonomuraea TaxID=2593643 RepID=UPI003402FF2E